MSLQHRWILALSLLCVCALADTAPLAAAPAVSGLAPVSRVDRLVLLDVTSAGSQLVAVGERGVIFRSGDQGFSWQGQRTEVTRTLTGIAFAGERTGVAVGHGGSLLRTEDSGATWNLVKVEDAARESLLGVTAVGANRFVAYGAFGLYLESTDGGKNWTRRKLIADDFDRHISKIFRLNDKLMLVGESGTLAVTDDGATWQRLTSPYSGSWFGGIRTLTGAALIFGMRGNVYRSEDGGKNWIKAELDAKRSVMNACLLPDGDIVLVGNAGLVAISRDDGKSFKPTDAKTSASLAQVLRTSAGELLAVGDQGLVRIAAPH